MSDYLKGTAMTNVLTLAHQELLNEAGLTDHHLQNVLHQLTGPHVDYADLYFQSVIHESWLLEDSLIKHGSFDIDRGVGVRVVSGEKTGFAYADDILLPALTEAAKAARGIVNIGGNSQVQAWHQPARRELYSPINPLTSFTEKEKIDLLLKIDSYIRKKDHRIKQVSISLSGQYENVLVMATDGTLSADIRPLVRLNVSVIVEDKGMRETGYAGGGGRTSYHQLLTTDLPYQYAEEALRQALINLEAIEAPAGMMTVVLGPGWPGVLLHEAVGHGLEGDFNRKGISAFSGRMGEKVASHLCTVVDDGTLLNRRGSLNIDDEGTPTQQTVLIENGVLKNYMMDKRNATCLIR